MLSARWRFVPAAVATALVAGFVAMLAWRPFDDATTRAIDDVGEAVVALAAAAALAWAASRRKGHQRAGWALLAGSAFAWGLGEVVWSWYELALHVEVPFPSWADAGYLAAVPLSILGMLTLLPDPVGRPARVRAVLDGAIISLALLSMSWALVLGPVHDASAGSDGLAQAISLAYPLGDVLTVSVAFLLAARVHGEERHAALVLALGVIGLALADSGFALLTALGLYQTGSLIDAGWVAGFAILGVAALMPLARSTRAAASREPVIGRAAIVLPYVPVAGATLVGADVTLQRGALEPVIVWTGIVMVGCLFARQIVALLENRALVAQLRDANARLQGIERFRVQLLNNVSHELATPLTPVALQLHLLERAPLGERERRSVDMVRRNVEQLQRLVADVKDVSHLEGGQLSIRASLVDARGIAETVAEGLQPTAAGRGVALRVTGPGPLLVSADPQRVAQVLSNLVGNALKFTRAGGEVEVACVKRGGEAVVTVRDTGRGLTEAEIARLFQPFSQVHAPGESPERGTGLGLYISRGIAEGHGGRLWVESAGKGCGSTFTLALPMG